MFLLNSPLTASFDSMPLIVSSKGTPNGLKSRASVEYLIHASSTEEHPSMNSFLNASWKLIR
jgi:hypothetical protein